MIKIVYLDNDSEIVSLDRIRKFQPIATGHTIQTYVRDCKECPLRWITGEIDAAYPDYTYDIVIDEETTMYRIPLVRIVK